jgi:hypothetical protein
MQSLAWRYVVLLLVISGTLVLALASAPIPQDPAYHIFADTRNFADIPNFLNVVSNLAFLLVGILGLRFCLRAKPGVVRTAWLILFAGVTLVSAGSAWYHWNPNGTTLVWDRLPMTIGFMGLFVAILGEYVNTRLAAYLLLPAITLGTGSVLYWYRTDDLRLYAWVQFMPLLTVLLVLLLFRSRFTHQGLLGVALMGYVLSKIAELYDGAIFSITRETVSGHSIKHLLAAAACYSILLMLQKRKRRT